MTLARPWQHPWAVVAGGISLRVRVTPRGGRDGVEGLVADPDGQPLVGIRVAAAPVDGDANDAVERLLAKWLGVPKTDVEITGGQSIRLKTVAIDGDPVQLIRRCQALVAAAAPAAKP
ncbi:hypothetical protein IP88_12015 [alpha proteobacterium AAP81b]|nr:hypothetical protein IP88_12015 [alpha proteobacterium AAP81b]